MCARGTCRMLVVLVAAIGSGCSPSGEREKASPRREAHSFNVIKAIDNSGGFLLNGYSDYKNSASQAMMPGAVLVVGVREGVTLGGQRFGYGAIVLVEGSDSLPTFRQAAENDTVELARDVTIFGRRFSPGPFKIPAGGTLADAGAEPSPAVSGAASVPPQGEFSGTVTETVAAFEKGGMNFRLKLQEYPGLVLAVPRKVAVAAGLYVPTSDTVEDARGWQVRVTCQEPVSRAECAVLSLRRAKR